MANDSQNPTDLVVTELPGDLFRVEMRRANKTLVYADASAETVAAWADVLRNAVTQTAPNEELLSVLPDVAVPRYGRIASQTPSPSLRRTARAIASPPSAPNEQIRARLASASLSAKPNDPAKVVGPMRKFGVTKVESDGE